MKKIITFFVLAMFMVLLVGCSNSNSNTGSNNTTNYTITFNSNGGTSVSSITKSSGTSVSAPSSPTKKGYTFGGWYTTSSLTTKVSWPMKLDGNKTFYAKWTKSSSSDSDSSGPKTVSITSSNFSTYFDASVKQTNMSTSNSGTSLTFKVSVSSKSGVKSISSNISVMFKFTVTYTYQFSGGYQTYTMTHNELVTVSVSSLSSTSKTVSVRLNHTGPLKSHKVSGLTISSVTGRITT